MLFSFITVLLFSCSREKNGILKKEQILSVYSNRYINENEYIFYKTQEDISWFKNFINGTITKQRIKEITKPVKGINFDSLLTTVDYQLWNKSLNKYNSITWNQEKLSSIPFIDENEIPDYYYGKGIPAPSDSIITIYKLSTPIISNNVALLYYSIKTSPLNSSKGYLMFAKINGKWQIVAKDVIVAVG
ncbi:MAG TPA: hypothetical protein VK106_06170 [Balneolaceae bacterium]|nr:hypothetical protein [Balneolaceae bacterium]